MQGRSNFYSCIISRCVGLRRRVPAEPLGGHKLFTKISGRTRPQSAPEHMLVGAIICVYIHTDAQPHIYICVYISHISHISFSGKYIILGRLVAGGRFYISISHVCLALVSMAPDGLCRVATDPLICCQIVRRLGFRASVCCWARLRL